MRINENNRVNLIYWKITAVFLAYDPLNRLPNIDIFEYDDEVKLFLKYLSNSIDGNENIEKILLKIFNEKIQEGLLLLMIDQLFDVLMEDYPKIKGSRSNRSLNIGKITKNSKVKIDYLKSTENFNTFNFNGERITKKTK